MRAGFYIRRRPQYHRGAGSAAQLYRRPATSGGGFRAGFTAARGLRAGVSRVEGGFRGLKLGRRNSWGGFHRGAGVEGGGFAG